MSETDLMIDHRNDLTKTDLMMTVKTDLTKTRFDDGIQMTQRHLAVYAVQLTKVIVIHVEATSADAALKAAVESDDNDQAWHVAEPVCEIIGRSD